MVAAQGWMERQLSDKNAVTESCKNHVEDEQIVDTHAPHGQEDIISKELREQATLAYWDPLGFAKFDDQAIAKLAADGLLG